MNKLLLCALSVLLASCALTPEQKAKQAQEQKRYEQDLQVHLAEQCDPETAKVLRQRFDNVSFDNEKEKQDFRLRYIEKVNDPMFQACYKMAWQNYTAQQRLREIRHRYWLDDWGFYRSPFLYPWYW